MKPQHEADPQIGPTGSIAGLGLRAVGLRAEGVGDAARTERLAWLAALAPTIDLADLDSAEADDDAVLAQHRASYDLLILHGADPAALCAIVARWRGKGIGKPVIALTGGHEPGAAVALLGAGADAVFSVRDRHDEARAFILALCRRSSQRQQPAPFDENPGEPLTAAERSILETLLATAGQFVGYDVITRNLAVAGCSVTRSSMKVVISRLRRKVERRYTIDAKMRFGYRASPFGAAAGSGKGKGAGKDRPTGAVASPEILSRRELQVLRKIGEGLNSNEIADELAISPRTVEVHRANMLAKLGAKNSAHAVRMAFAKGIIDPQ